MFKGLALDSNQLNLFLDLPLEAATRSPTLLMDKPALVRWKSQIYNYQQRVREGQSGKQTTLFDLTPTHCDPGKINPFNLQLQSMAFWRFPANSFGESCVYFVVDSAVPLLLISVKLAGATKGGKELTTASAISRSTKTCTTNISFHAPSTWHFGGIRQQILNRGSS